jgi:uncharacterized membrane protein
MSDSVDAGQAFNGHGRGMCQWGTQRWSVNQAKDYIWITNHYYNDNGNPSGARSGLLQTPSADFSISATPSSQMVAPGGSTSYTVTVTALGGFTGTVTFGASGLPAGATASFNPASVAGSGSSTMTVTTSSTTPTGTYTLTVTGTSGTLQHTATVTLVVSNPDFSISATPSSKNIRRGNSGSYTVTVTPAAGFNGAVTFSVSALPSGTTANFNPTSVVGSGSSTMTVTVGSTTAKGTYTLTITGASGTLSHTATVSLTVK